MKKFNFVKLFIQELKNKLYPSIVEQYVILSFLVIYICYGALFYSAKIISGPCYTVGIVFSVVAGVLLFYPKKVDKEGE